MQVLLSSSGSRGDVQPILALGLELQALGHRARLCVAPNFKEWIESYGLECVPIGPDLKKMTGGTVPGKPILPFSKEQLQGLADQMVRGQFQVIADRDALHCRGTGHPLCLCSLLPGRPALVQISPADNGRTSFALAVGSGE